MVKAIDNSYGISNQHLLTDEVDIHVERIKIQGFSIIENVFEKNEMQKVSLKIDDVYFLQTEEFGKENLKQCHELDMVRCPLAYDSSFIHIALQEKVLNIVERLLGKYFILHLQNAIINRPYQQHHQTAWHRDLPYQHFVSSMPLALSALYCVDDFNEETGGTLLLPFSHKLESMPSDSYIRDSAITVNAKAGSVLIFDSMLFHRAGFNKSNRIRRGINHVFSIPLIKQQICLPSCLNSEIDLDPYQLKILGFGSESAASVLKYRRTRMAKIK